MFSICNEGSKNQFAREYENEERRSIKKTSLFIAAVIVTFAIISVTVTSFVKITEMERQHRSICNNHSLAGKDPTGSNIEGSIPEVSRDRNTNIDEKLEELSTQLNKAFGEIEELERKFTLRVNDSKLANHQEAARPASCQEAEDGVQILQSGEKVYCSDGWLVVQRRTGEIPDFHSRSWDEYANGFGSVHGEFWWGLKKINLITESSQCGLRVDLWSWDNDHRFAEYRSFTVDNEASKFSIGLAGYTGNAGDSLLVDDTDNNVNGMQFTTVDQDHDRRFGSNCAKDMMAGGWWHNDCSKASPNGIYRKRQDSKPGIKWFGWRKEESLESIMLKVRCH